MAKKGQIFKTTDEGLIFKIVQEKINGKAYSELEKKYGISRGSMMTWVKRYRDKGYVTRDRRGLKKDIKKKDDVIRQQGEELRQRDEVLRQQGEELRQQGEELRQKDEIILQLNRELEAFRTNNNG